MQRVYDFTLGATVGAVTTINAQGNYFKVRATTAGPVAVKLDGGAEIICEAGQGLRGVGFRTIELRNLQAVANSGTIFIGSAEYEDSRIAGSVYVIDQSADKTDAGFQFWGICNRAAAVGAVSLAGVLATGRTCYVKRMWVSSMTSGLVGLWSCSGQTTVNPANNAGAGVNKSIGGAASSAWAIRGDAASGVPTLVELPGRSGIGDVYVTANQYAEIGLTTPIRLGAGFGIVASGYVVNRDVSMLFDIEER